MSWTGQRWTEAEDAALGRLRSASTRPRHIALALTALRIGPARTTEAVQCRLRALDGRSGALYVSRRGRFAAGGTVRACMCCRRPFPSAGHQNRLCERCNDLAASLSPLHPPDLPALDRMELK